MSPERDRIHDMISALKQQRDELSLRMHLAGSEAKQEWSRLDEKLNQVLPKLGPLRNAVGQSTDDLLQSLKLVAEEIQHGFERIRRTL